MKTIIKISGITFLLNIFLIGIILAQNCTNCSNTTTGTNASAIGENTHATGIRSFASGYEVYTPGAMSFGHGKYINVDGANSVVIGRYAETTTSPAMVIGYGANNSSRLENGIPNSLMFGFFSDKSTFFIGESNGAGTTGKIGIGDVTDPQAKLHIKGDADNGGNPEDADILLEPGSSMKYARIKFGTTGNTIDARGSQDLNFHTASDFVFWDANVGIGTDNPSEKLDVTGTVKSTGLKLTDGTQAAGKILQSDTDGNASWVSATSIDDGDWIVKSFGNDIYRLNGSVGIGTDLSQNPNNYKLAVNGIIGTKEVYVENSSITWSDYVFSDDYNLLSLREVEEYIKTNGHLPEVPTAEEVNINGLKLAEMNALLLKKIEELTLYIIDLQKESQVLKEGFEGIKCEISKNQ